MSLEKLVSQAQDAKLLYATEHLLYPILHKMLETKTAIMCAGLTKGDRELLVLAAQVSLIRDLITEVDALKRQGSRAIKKLEE